MSGTTERRGLLVRGLLSLIVLIASGALLFTTEPRLGLDLEGGTQITLEGMPGDGVVIDEESMNQTLEVIRRRVDSLGVAEPNLVRSGDDRVVVELPGVEDPEEALATIGRTAQLTIHPVIAAASPEEAEEAADPEAQTTQELVLTDENGAALRLAPAAMTGEAINRATARLDGQTGRGWYVGLDFADAGGWAQVTGQAACAPYGDPARRVAIVLDNTIISAPEVQGDTTCNVGITGGGETSITGDFNQEEAEQLALLISDGALPVPVEVVEQRTLGPTLGQDAIDASITAAVIGISITGLFLIVVYRLAGLIAAIALTAYTVIAFGLLLALGATITLPGLAGFVLAIGMAMDANVLIYERSREEYAGSVGTKSAKRRMTNAVNGGFKGAITAIADSNITTLLAAALLFALATGPVRGFGITLSTGVIASMFSALVLSRVLQQLVFRGPIARHPKISGIAHLGRLRQWFERRSPDFLKPWRKWLIGFGIVLVVVGSGLAVRDLNLGVDFTGGRYISYQAEQEPDLGAVRASLEQAGFEDAAVSGADNNGLTVRTGPLEEERVGDIREAVVSAVGPVEQLQSDLIGPSLGEELRDRAILALLLGAIAQVVYLSFRFDWRLGVAVIVGLAADVVFLLGVFAWTGRLIDGVFVASMLTVIGYSVNDSVVVFDRVRELRAERPKDPFYRVAGSAVLQTMPRTVNTGIGVLAVLGALLFLGSGSLVDFALAVIIGAVIGNVTTIVVAAPLAIALDTKWPGAARVRKKKKRDEHGSGAVV
ncbi:SecD/SecF fusion protein [Actinoalloteichus hoggarensis]|uniref:Multifunctional fusion protein n=1 Tax=Actinoalloteichus hoggarensis TaxID=1470176 RepID=A0A221W2K4_9PSEU|nr:protein translocase subunit SecD [Actinoalloteichus hoggarensis]ASO20032.1 Multidrug resistance protein MexB [Actinoalloteichus hoggarensis]MBB5919257.1 SecD/SecF fusion protein [Actinoalloteichus hoggarensis]